MQLKIKLHLQPPAFQVNAQPLYMLCTLADCSHTWRWDHHSIKPCMILRSVKFHSVNFCQYITKYKCSYWVTWSWSRCMVNNGSKLCSTCYTVIFFLLNGFLQKSITSCIYDVGICMYVQSRCSIIVYTNYFPFVAIWCMIEIRFGLCIQVYANIPVLWK